MQSRWEHDWANADPRPPWKRPKSEVIDASNFVKFMVERSSTLDMFDVMEAPIASWNFPSDSKGWTTRALNLFTVNEIKTIGALVQLSENDLGRMSQMGRATLHEITERLAEFGLYLVDSIAHQVVSNQK
jgi:DNA-directed RNA polymerase alpha subunit